MSVAPILLSKWANACCRHGRKKKKYIYIYIYVYIYIYISVTQNLLHERLVWWGMHGFTYMYTSERRCYRGCRRLRIGGRECLASAASLQHEREWLYILLLESYAFARWWGGKVVSS